MRANLKGQQRTNHCHTTASLIQKTKKIKRKKDVHYSMANSNQPWHKARCFAPNFCCYIVDIVISLLFVFCIYILRQYFLLQKQDKQILGIRTLHLQNNRSCLALAAGPKKQQKQKQQRCFLSYNSVQKRKFNTH